MIVPSWYKIPEINFQHFRTLLKPMFSILEQSCKHKSSEDPFLTNIWSNYHQSNFRQDYGKAQMIRALSMALGTLHEEIISSFPHWHRIQRHKTKSDIIGYKGKYVVEVKNNINTMNSSSKTSVYTNLLYHIQERDGNKAYLVIINNCPNDKETLDNGIIIYSGKYFYHKLSKRSDFFNDLLETITYIFTHYKTFNQLIQET